MNSYSNVFDEVYTAIVEVSIDERNVKFFDEASASVREGVKWPVGDIVGQPHDEIVGHLLELGYAE